MNSKTLQIYINKNKEIFQDLAKCGSVPELLIRQTVYGQNWNRWSWGIFIYFLWHHITNSRLLNNNFTEEFECCVTMLDDIIQTIDNGPELDSIFTNKIVIKQILQIIDLGNARLIKELNKNNFINLDILNNYAGLLCILSHVFAKFPKLWTINWMFIRHTTLQKKAIRTHRLKYFVPVALKRPAIYFESNAFMEDFIHKYWDYKKYC